METVSYIAKAEDSRCKWWSVRIPRDTILGSRINSPFLRSGADLELSDGDALVESEAIHHRRNRGFRVRLIIASGGTLHKLVPKMEHKQHIKAATGSKFMEGSGDVEACVRIALYLWSLPADKMAEEIEALKAL